MYKSICKVGTSVQAGPSVARHESSAIGTQKPRKVIGRRMIIRAVFWTALLQGATVIAATPQNAPKTESETLTPDAIFSRAAPSVVRIVAEDLNFKEIGLGSGFFVATNGVLVTNYHVVKGAVFGRVVLANNATFELVGLLAWDEQLDIAVLKVNGTDLPRLELASRGNVPPVGTRVYAIGNPQGLTNTLSEGLVSGIRKDSSDGLAAIQVTTPISPGSSGGPLIDAQGKVLGITTFFVQAGQNLNFAVPSDAVQRLLSKCAPSPVAMHFASSFPVGPYMNERTQTAFARVQIYLAGAENCTRRNPPDWTEATKLLAEADASIGLVGDANSYDAQLLRTMVSTSRKTIDILANRSGRDSGKELLARIAAILDALDKEFGRGYREEAIRIVMDYYVDAWNTMPASAVTVEAEQSLRRVYVTLAKPEKEPAKKGSPASATDEPAPTPPTENSSPAERMRWVVYTTNLTKVISEGKSEEDAKRLAVQMTGVVIDGTYVGRPSGVPAQTKGRGGFRGIAWAEGIASVPGMVAVPSPEAYKGFIYYARAGEKKTWGDASVFRVTYGFYKGRFFYARVECLGVSNFAALRRAVVDDYGVPANSDPRTFTWWWTVKGPKESARTSGEKMLGIELKYDAATQYTNPTSAVGGVKPRF